MAEEAGDINNREPRVATPEEQSKYLQNHRQQLLGTLGKWFDAVGDPLSKQQLPPLTEVGKQLIQQGSSQIVETPIYAAKIKMWPAMQHQYLADELFYSRATPQDIEGLMETVSSKEDRDAIHKLFTDKIQAHVWSKNPILTEMNGEKIQFADDQDWLNNWKMHLQLNNQQNPGFFKRGLNAIKHQAGRMPGAESVKSGAEALIDRMGQVLENKKAFGRSVANFALHGAATRGLSMGSRELAKGIVSYSGLAGAIGGGITGTVVAGAFVGAVSGALVEYARQVNRNLDTKAETDPTVAGRKAAFLLKFKELRHKEVLKPTDLKKIRNAAIFGAIAGAGGGALVEYIPGFSELVKEHIGGLRSVFSGVGEAVGSAAGGIGHATGEIASNAKDLAGGAKDMAENIPGAHGVGDIAGGIGGAVGETAGTVGRTTGELLGRAGEITDRIPGVTGAKETAEGVWRAVGLGDAHGTAGEAAQGANQAAHEAIPTPDGFVPQADYDDLQRQLAETKQALDTAKGVVPVGGVAAATAQTVTEHAADQASVALESLGSNIPLETGSNPWEVSADILKQMGIRPTPEQIMQLDHVLSQENGISVPEWGIKGTIDAHNLPIGFKLNLTDAVKKAALGIANKK